MYQLTLTNQSNAMLTVSDGEPIEPGQTWQSGELGDVFVDIPARGPLSFHDIADAHIGGDSKETWGVLIAYQGEEFVGRYEGGGRLEVTINGYYQAELAGMDLRQVSLPPITLAGAAQAA